MQNRVQHNKKKPYERPAIIYSEKLEVLASVCDYNWVPNRVCRIVGEPSCVKTRI